MIDRDKANATLKSFIQTNGFDVLDDRDRLLAISLDLPLPDPVRLALPQVALIGVARDLSHYANKPLSTADWARYSNLCAKRLALPSDVISECLETWCRALGVEPPETKPAVLPPVLPTQVQPQPSPPGVPTDTTVSPVTILSQQPFPGPSPVTLRPKVTLTGEAPARKRGWIGWAVGIPALILAVAGGVRFMHGPNDFEGKIFHHSDSINYFQFDHDSSSLYECSDLGLVRYQIAGTYHTAVRREAGRSLAVILTKSAGSSEVKWQAWWVLLSGDHFDDDGDSLDSNKNKYGDDKRAGTGYLDNPDLSSMVESGHPVFSVKRDGVAVPDDAECQTLLATGGLSASNIQYAILYSPTCTDLKAMDSCVEVLKIPYQVSDGVATLDWSHAKTPAGADPYDGTVTVSTAAAFNFNSINETWTPIAKGESYTRTDVKDAPSTIERVTVLPMKTEVLTNH